MKKYFKANDKNQRVDFDNFTIGDAYAISGSFQALAGTYSGTWYEAPATDSSGKRWRIIWTTVNWEIEDESDACDWDNPDYIFDEYGYEYVKEEK